jgi:hydroxymethylglutaryl-CoA lyase
LTDSRPEGKVWFTEVGPRDGFQNWPRPVSTPVKLELIHAALDAGVPRVEVTSMVSPKWVPQLADAETVLETLRDEGGDVLQRVRVLVPNLKGMERASRFFDDGLANVLVNVGVTEGFNRHNLNRSVEETLQDVGEVVAAAAPKKVRVDASVSVAWGCPYDGPVAPERAVAVAQRLAEIGVAELSFGDTIGVAAPAEVRRLSEMALQVLAGIDVAMHFHDTRGLGVANAQAALAAGVRLLEGSIGGIGGCPFAPNSTGNVCSEDMLAMVTDLGYETGIDLDRMVAAAVSLERALGEKLPGKLHLAGPAPWLAPSSAAGGAVLA